MSWPAVALLGVLGLLAGSFATTLIRRAPAGIPLLDPGPQCPSCGDPVRPGDLVPLLSWILLRGRCRSCGAPIGVRYPMVELATGSLFLVMALALGLVWALPAFLYLAAVGLALAVIDLDTKRLPNILTLPSYPIVAGLLLLPAVIEGQWASYGRALLGGLALFVTYLVLALIYPAGMGLGDVKLSGVLGLCLGWLGWGALVVGSLAAFVLASVVGIVLMVGGRAGRRTMIPFGPFMLAGALVGILVGQQVGDWYVGQLGM